MTTTATGGTFFNIDASSPVAAPPVISNITESAVLLQTATIGWVTDIFSTSQVCYSTDHAYGTCTTLDAVLVTSHSVGLSSLIANTQYFYVVKSQDAFNNLTTSSEGDITTANAPTISGEAESAITNTTATVIWSTNVASDSKVCYSTDHSYSTCTTLDTNLVTSHSVGVSGLTASTTYFYVVKSQAAAGAVATSSEGTFATTFAATGDPTLPLATVNVSMPWTLGTPLGSTLSVTSCGTSPTTAGTLPYALATAVSGDEIQILSTLDCTYAATLTLPKTTTGWVIITTSAFASLPAAGTRIDPTASYVTAMPRLTMTTGAGRLFTPANAARGYRFIGLELRFSPGVDTTASFGILSGSPAGTTSDSNATNEIYVDRCWIHCDPWQSCSRGIVQTGGRNFAVIDSYIHDSKTTNGQQDGGAIVGSNMDWGPFLVRNNFLSAGAEVVQWAGNPTTTQVSAMPYDITVKSNHIQTPLHWWPNFATQYYGARWLPKNLFEVKCASRVDIDGNVFEYKLNANTSQRFAIVIKRNNQNTANTACETDDISFRNNVVRRADGGFTWTGPYELDNNDVSPGTIRSRRVAVTNNLFDDVQAVTYDNLTGSQNRAIFYTAKPSGTGYATWYNPVEFTIAHNTAINSSTGQCMSSFSSTVGDGFSTDINGRNANLTTLFILKDNFLCNGIIHAGGVSTGNGLLDWFADAGNTFVNKNNFLGGVTCASSNHWYDVGLQTQNCAGANAKFFNAVDAAFYTANFTNQPGGDFRLLVGSGLHNAASDGTDVGISDWTKIPSCYTGGGATNPIVALANPITATSLGASVICNGSNTVTVTGTNFKRGTQAVFDVTGTGRLLYEENSSLVVDGATQLTIKPPTRAAGTYKVFVFYAGILAGGNTNDQTTGAPLTYTCS